MKRWSIKIAIGVAVALALLTVLGRPRGRTSVPSLTVKVLDARSHEPLGGIPVLYALETTTYPTPWFLEFPDPFASVLGFRAKGETDAHGIVRFDLSEAPERPMSPFMNEYLFVNMVVDMDGREAKIVVETHEEFCRRGDYTCDGPATEVDVAWVGRLLKSDRSQLFTLPHGGHMGHMICIAPPGRYNPSDFSENDSVYEEELHVSERRAPEEVVVELSPVEYPKPAASSPLPMK